MSGSTTPLLEARNLAKTFGRGTAAVRAVDNVSLSVDRGELVLIMGPSGSGKTTLLSILGALLRADDGEITIGGTRIDAMSGRQLARFRAQRIGFIFQAFNLLSALTVRENILFPARFGAGLNADVEQRGDWLIDRLGLDSRRGALPAQLSGGEKQRAAIARSLINDPPVILADEPTGNLDSARGQEVMMILHDVVRDEGKSVLIVTHDPRVEDVCDRLLWLEDGALRSRAPAAHDWARDPVCGMRVDRREAAETSAHRGTRYFFCSRRCRERFTAAPQTYIRGE